MTIYIENRPIGPEHSPFVIAELSGNHSQNKQLALDMIAAAAECGAHAIKLQSYTADSMTLDLDTPDFTVGEKDSLWSGEKLYDLYLKAATPYEWHEELFQYARSLGLIPFSSPFDNHAVDFLNDIGCPCFKIASFELTDLPLIAYAAKLGKPMIMSTGMASLSEIEAAVATAKQAGCRDIILLKCTSTYPAQASNTNLNTIPHMRETFGCQVGLSDHTKGIGVAVAAVGMGATVIEKHFVLDRQAGGVDADFSMEPAEMKSLVEESQRAFQAIGTITYGGTNAEANSKKYRRSIYVCEDIQEGETFSDKNLKIVRPAFGLAPKHWPDIIGRKAQTNMKKGHALRWQDVGQ